MTPLHFMVSDPFAFLTPLHFKSSAAIWDMHGIASPAVSEGVSGTICLFINHQTFPKRRPAHDVADLDDMMPA